MKKVRKIRVDKRGRMTLPAWLREYLNIKPKALIYYTVTDDSVTLKAAVTGKEAKKK